MLFFYLMIFSLSVVIVIILNGNKIFRLEEKDLHYIGFIGGLSPLYFYIMMLFSFDFSTGKFQTLVDSSK